MLGDPSQDGRPHDDERLSALCEDAAWVVRALEAYAASKDPDSALEIKDALYRIGAGLPFTPYVQPEVYKVETIDLSDWLITCPVCDNGFIVHGPTWVHGSTEYQAKRALRICPYCEEESLVIDKRPQWQRAKDRE